MDDTTFEDTRQVPALVHYTEYPLPNESKLIVVPKRKGAIEFYYCVFADGPFVYLMIDLPITLARELFLRLASTLVANSGNVANYHVDTLCTILTASKQQLYNATSMLKKGHLIKKWKTGKYVLNPYCVWAYDQRHLQLARTLWQNWDVTPKEEINDTLTLISTRIK